MQSSRDQLPPRCLPRRLRRLKSLAEFDALQKFKSFSKVNPASQIPGEDIALDVNLIYTEVEIKGAGREIMDMPFDHSTVFQYVHEELIRVRKPTILLMEGIAGMGKSTFLKYIMSQWKIGSEDMTELEHFDLMIFMEFRNPTISNIKGLVLSQWPTVREEFEIGDEMIESLLKLKLLILCDGFDELNETSKQLFTDFIYKMNENTAMVCTTRPENVGDYYRLVSNTTVNTIHVKINGLSGNCRKTFIRRYHEALRSRGRSYQETAGLLKLFKFTETHLADHWSIPLNLTLLTVLWALDCWRVNLITTATELYKQVQVFTEEKVLERIAKNFSYTDHSIIKRNLKNFVDQLCMEAVINLQQNTTILDEGSVKRLKDCCAANDIPEREALGAFLHLENTWESTSLVTTIYRFFHKGQQEFYAGNYIYARTVSSDKTDTNRASRFIRRLSSRFNTISTRSVTEYEREDNPTLSLRYVLSYKFRDGFRSLKRKTKRLPIPSNESHQATSPEEQNKTKIFDILKETHKTDAIPLHKYRNTLVMLMGLLCQEEWKMESYLLEELVELLKMSGVNDKEGWIKVLSNVKCNNTIASLIANCIQMTDCTTEISDYNTFAYATVIKEQKPKCLKITIKEDPTYVPRLEELLHDTACHACHIEDLDLKYLFHNPTANISCRGALRCLMERCNVEAYSGCFVPGMQFPPTMKSLKLSLADAESYQELLPVLTSLTQLQVLRVCLSPDVDLTSLQPLPGKVLLHLYIPDIRHGRDIVNASTIAKALQPIHNITSFWNMAFPRAALTTSQCRDLLQEMTGVKVEGAIIIPESCRPSSMEDEQRLQEMATHIFHSRIKWKESLDDW